MGKGPLTVTILGCGSSGGVPLVGCACAVCKSTNPKNDRTRASILVEQDGKRLLIDTSPDLRMQCLRENISTVDAILFTHNHADHTHGIDDTRGFNYNAKGIVPIYGDAATMADLTTRFPFRFRPSLPEYGTHQLTAHTVEAGATHTIAGFQVQLFNQIHGKTTSLGIRIGNFAYSTDVNMLDDAAFTTLNGVDVWVVDCLRPNPSPTHSHLERTLEWIERVKPVRAVLFHMSHEFEYEALKASLPAGVEPAFDGMKIRL